MDPRLKHLELIHNVITRLATDSFQLKRWAVALFSGLLAFLFGTESTRHTTILLFPVVVFWGLDGYFLWRERLFRALYDHVRLAQSSATDFSMDVDAFRTGWRRSWCGATLSPTLILFYGALVASILGALFLDRAGEFHDC